MNEAFPKSHFIGIHQLHSQQQEEDGDDVGTCTEAIVHEIIGSVCTKSPSIVLNFLKISSVLHSRLFFPTCHEMRRKGKYQEQRYDDDEETDHEAETVSLEH